MFVLHYEMDQPLSSIIHREAAKGYLRVFRLLWGMRRVEHSLNGAWKQMTLTERILGQLRTTARRNGLTVPGMDGVWGELRHSHRVLSDMAHFATNMQTYLHFEVMEASWEDFCRDLRCDAALLPRLPCATPFSCQPALNHRVFPPETLNAYIAQVGAGPRQPGGRARRIRGRHPAQGPAGGRHPGGGNASRGTARAASGTAEHSGPCGASQAPSRAGM